MTVIERYWKALAAGDAETMAKCYAADATFQDPVFNLNGAEIGNMWRMILAANPNLRIEAGALVQDGVTAHGTWQAWYKFSLTGRDVHNVIHSSFTVEGNKIVAQRDEFPFWKWSRMALGLKGILLGWTPLVHKAVRAKARERLDRFQSK